MEITRKIAMPTRQQSTNAAGNFVNNGCRDKSQFASKFSICGCIASLALLSFLSVASLFDVRITKSVTDQERRSLLFNKAYYDRNLNQSIAIDIDCGDIFRIASQIGTETKDDEKSNNESALLCHYAKSCKSSGWPSRILLPLLLCHGLDDSTFNNDTEMIVMSNSTTASASSSQSSTKTSSISTALLVILLFVPLLLYLLLLFRLLATTADNYFSPALETFSFELGLPPRFAGATLLALGNGSPDLGSTVNAILLWNEKEADGFAAVNAADNIETQGWTMSLGDLIGGGMFVGTIVCGLLVNECSGIQCRVAFLRDVSMYALSVGYVWHVLESKRVTQVDAWGLLGIYVVYVGIVLCADVFHKKVTMERINLEAKERRKSISELKASRLSELYDAMSVDDSNLGQSADELTPIMLASNLPNYSNEEEDAVDRDDVRVPDITLSVSTSFDRQLPRPRLSVTDRFAMLMSNYDPASVRYIGSNSTLTDESKDSEVGAIYNRIHDIRHPLLRSVSSPPALDDSSTHYESVIANETLNQVETPRHSNLPSPPPSDTSAIALKDRSWSFELLIDAYEELVYQSQQFIENFFKNKTSTMEKIVIGLELPFTIARVLTIPLPVEDHYCRPIVALSILFSPLWILYYRGKDFFTVSAASFILVALMIALAVLRYADEHKMPLVACIPLSLYGFLIAATWIDSIGSALVDLLQFYGTFLRIPPGILGMTVLAIGNSMGDLSSNLALAKNGVSLFVRQPYVLRTSTVSQLLIPFSTL